jgi:hypothetical protein
LGELLRFGQWVHQTGSDWVPLSARVGLREELPRPREDSIRRPAAGHPRRATTRPLGGARPALRAPAAGRERDRPRRRAAGGRTGPSSCPRDA